MIKIEQSSITAPGSWQQSLNEKQGAEIDGYFHYTEGVRKLRVMKQQQEQQAAAAEYVKDRMKAMRRSRD